MLPEILGELGWNTYMVGKWHLCPTVEMNLASTRRNWPTGRGFERLYGFLGAETSQWYPGADVRQPSGGPAEDARGGLPLRRGHHRQGDRVHHGREGGRAGQAVLPVLRPRCRSRAAPRAAGTGSTGTRASSTWAMRRCARRRWPGRRRWASSLPTPSCPPINPIGTPETRTGPEGQPFPPLDVTRPWDSLSDDGEAAVRADGGGVRGFPLPRRPPDRPTARLPRGRPASERTR